MNQENTDYNRLLNEVSALVRSYNSTAPEKIQQLIDLARQNNQSLIEAKARFEMARYFLSVKADYPEAEKNILQSLTALGENADREFYARVQRIYGTVKYYQNDFAGAQNLHKAAIDSLEKLVTTNTVLSELGENYLQLALLNKVTEFKDLRKLMAEKAFAYFKQANDNFGLGRCHTIFASIYFYDEQYEKALETHLKALDCHQESGNRQGVSVALNNIGSCYRELGDLEKAHEYLIKSLELKQQLGNPNSIANSHFHLAELHSYRKEYSKAIEEYKKAIAIFETVGNKLELNFAYGKLSEVYETVADYKNALDYLKLRNQMQNEVYGYEKITAVADAVAKYEIEKREKEADLLRQQNFQIEEYTHKLEISNKELEQFAHVASHDLREPLRMIGSYVGLLQRKLEGRLNEEEEQFMQFVLEGTKRMDHLIRDLLEYSKINAEALTQPVDVNEVLVVVKQTLSEAAAAKNATINFGPMPVIKADKTLVLQLLQNLVSNALKYNLSNEPVVKVSYQHADNNLQFKISDNGIGIPMEHRDKIFEIFRRLHAKEKFSGSGIGLAICKKIVDQMKGKIWVEDNPGGGSVFCILLNDNILIEK